MIYVGTGLTTSAFSLGMLFVLAQTSATPPNDASQTFFNLASLVLAVLSAVVTPVVIRYLKNLKTDVDKSIVETKAAVPDVTTIKDDVSSLHTRIDNLVDSLNSEKKEKEAAYRERDDARKTLEKANDEFLKTSERQKKELEDERKNVANMLRTVESHEEEITKMKAAMGNLLSMNQLADMLIDRFENSFQTKMIPEVIRLVSAVAEGKGLKIDGNNTE